MLYLATASGPLVRDAMTAGLLGQMITPKAGNRLVPGATFAIDNGVVKLVDKQPVNDPAWSVERWRARLVRYQHAPDCLFAVVPDAVGDASETDRRWRQWAPAVRHYGYRAAYVAQNGCSRIPDDADVLFIGGDTAWKLGAQVRRLIAWGPTTNLPKLLAWLYPAQPSLFGGVA